MTTRPTAKKYRIRRDSSLIGDAFEDQPDPRKGHQAPTGGTVQDADAPHVAPEPVQPSGIAQEREATVVEPGGQSVEEELDAIRAEGLTGRQLRTARRLAQRNGITAASDFDAVRLLRKNGIDPFQRVAVLDLVPNEGAANSTGGPPHVADLTEVETPRVGLPGPARVIPPLDLPNGRGNAAAAVLEIQRDIARRRRRRLALLGLRLAFFVLLPAMIAGWYFYRVATPMYSAHSAFVIQQAEPSRAGLAGMFSGTAFATSQDSISVQEFLQSREAMMRLDTDLRLRDHFSQPHIDAIQRLPADATQDDLYKLYGRHVKIGYDPTEGILRMEVIAEDPDTATAFSKALLGYAEEHVDRMTLRLREDQMAGARASYEQAEQNMLAAQKHVLDLQEQLGVLDPKTEVGSRMAQISVLETELRQKQLQLEQLLDNAQPNAARVEGLRGDIRRLEALIAELRATMTTSGEGNASLARISGELRVAETNLQTRQLMLGQSLQQLETARIEANRQVRYLSTSFAPVASDQQTYPRAFENTMLALLIFAGIYLLLSLTAAILREQVTS